MDETRAIPGALVSAAEWTAVQVKVKQTPYSTQQTRGKSDARVINSTCALRGRANQRGQRRCSQSLQSSPAYDHAPPWGGGQAGNVRMRRTSERCASRQPYSRPATTPRVTDRWHAAVKRGQSISAAPGHGMMSPHVAYPCNCKRGSADRAVEDRTETKHPCVSKLQLQLELQLAQCRLGLPPPTCDRNKLQALQVCGTGLKRSAMWWHSWHSWHSWAPPPLRCYIWTASAAFGCRNSMAFLQSHLDDNNYPTPHPLLPTTTTKP